MQLSDITLGAATAFTWLSSFRRGIVQRHVAKDYDHEMLPPAAAV